jgi:hypothetical protein
MTGTLLDIQESIEPIEKNARVPRTFERHATPFHKPLISTRPALLTH